MHTTFACQCWRCEQRRFLGIGLNTVVTLAAFYVWISLRVMRIWCIMYCILKSRRDLRKRKCVYYCTQDPRSKEFMPRPYFRLPFWLHLLEFMYYRTLPNDRGEGGGGGRRLYQFLPARRYASAGLCYSDVSVCPSVCHTPVLCLVERKQDREMYTVW